MHALSKTINKIRSIGTILLVLNIKTNTNM